MSSHSESLLNDIPSLTTVAPSTVTALSSACVLLPPGSGLGQSPPPVSHHTLLLPSPSPMASLGPPPSAYVAGPSPTLEPFVARLVSATPPRSLVDPWHLSPLPFPARVPLLLSLLLVPSRKSLVPGCLFLMFTLCKLGLNQELLSLNPFCPLSLLQLSLKTLIL